MLNFRQGGDSGYNESASIVPFDNGEDATQTIFRRPPENLRARHEVLRKAFDNLEAVVSSDRGLTIMSDMDTMVTWDGVAGGGTFTITTGNDLRIVPIVSFAKIGGGTIVYAQMRHEPDHAGHPEEFFRIESVLKASAGGNNLFFEMYKVGTDNPVNPVVSVEGGADTGNDPAEGPLVIRVQIAFNDSHTYAHVVTAVNADPDANVLVTAEHDLAWVQTQTAVVFPYQSLAFGLSPADPADTKSIGGLDTEGFRATAAQIAAFFAGAETPHVLDEGDVLVFDYASAEVRRGKTLTSAPGLKILHEASTDDIDLESGNAARMHVVPICKVLNDKLHFLNGTVVVPGGPVSLMQTDSPFVIVGPGGHYATVQAALTALGTTGGTIFIKSGIYAEALTLSNINYDITLIGEGVDIAGASKGVVLKNAGPGGNLIIADVGISSRTTFVNLRLEQDSNAAFLLAINESVLERARITFHDCVFLHTSATADILFDHTLNLEFFDCYFKGTQDGTPVNTATVFRPYAETNPGITHLRVERCYFENFAEIAEIGKAAKQVNVGSFVFNDNVIHECGLTTAVGVIGLLIKGLNADFYAKIEMNRNRWSTGDTDAASGCFCGVYGEGIISHNILTRGILGHVPAGDAYMITALEGTGQTAKFLIENNHIEPYRGNIIKTQNALVRGNYTENFHAGGTVYGYRFGDESIVVGNIIGIANPTSAANILFATWGAAGTIKIVDNIVTGLHLNDIGILADRPKVVIRNNTLVSFLASYAGGVGIKVDSAQCVVSGNQIDDMCFGIQLTVNAANDDNIIANNIIRLGDDDNSHGIEIDAGCHGNSILGNTIRGGAGATQYGIDLNGSNNVVIGGNTVLSCDLNIFETASTGCGMQGNHATGELAFSGVTADAETVTIGGKVYTYKNALGGADGDILKGTATQSRDRLVAAIMLDAGAGVGYDAATTRHPTAVAVAKVGVDTAIVQAKVEGTQGETIATAETLVNGAWSAGSTTKLTVVNSPISLGFNWR